MGVHDCRKVGIIHRGLRIESNSPTPLHNPRAVIYSQSDSLVTFKLEAMFVPQVEGHLPEDNTRFHEVLQTLLPASGYFLCPGLPNDVASLLTFDTKSARRWGLPFGRVDHKDCLLWVKVASSSKGQPLRCEKCTNLMYYVRRAARKRRSMSAEQKAKRVLPSSHCPLKYLSPASLPSRRRNIAHEKKAQKRKVIWGMASDNSLPTMFIRLMTSADSTTHGL